MTIRNDTLLCIKLSYWVSKTYFVKLIQGPHIYSHVVDPGSAYWHTLFTARRVGLGPNFKCNIFGAYKTYEDAERG